MAVPATAEPFADWASAQRRRAVRDGAWKVRCEERCEDGAVLRAVSTWHSVGPDCRRRQSTGSSRVPRHSRSTRRRARASGSSGSPNLSALSGSCESAAPTGRIRNARQKRSAERSAQHHAKLVAEAGKAAAGEAETAAPVSIAAADISAAAPAPSSKRERDDEPSGALLSMTGGAVAASAALPQRPLKGLRVGFLLGLLLPLGLF